ncbi:MAG: hypothetical protein H7338_01860 [Candidatus Sericytochromatia bacterium]|nr:hypothetical protein [Candidatus Sericytochromatia bacterium]
MTATPNRFYLPLLIITLLSGCGASPRVLASVQPVTAAAKSIAPAKPPQAKAAQPVSAADREDLTEAVRRHFPQSSMVSPPTISNMAIVGPATGDVVEFRVTVRQFIKGFVQDWNVTEASGQLDRRTGRVTWH